MKQPRLSKTALAYVEYIEARHSQLIDKLQQDHALRVQDLLEANNRYLNRARVSEASTKDAWTQLNEALDKIDFMQGEYDAAVAQHLEQDTWARMEIEKQKRLISDWQLEAKEWAAMFGRERQNNEQEFMRANEWLRQVSINARIMLFFDLAICLVAMLILAGATPPVIDIFGWWY